MDDGRRVQFVSRSPSEEEGGIEPSDGDGRQFDREQHAAHDGLWRRRGQKKMDAEKFRWLSRRGLPGREQDRNHQGPDHSIEDIETQLFGRLGVRGCTVLIGALCVEAAAALGAEPIYLWQ